MPVEHQDAADWRWMLINGASLLPAADLERYTPITADRLAIHVPALYAPERVKIFVKKQFHGWT